MKFDFQVKNKKEYTILRDYYVSNNHLQGIYFLLYNDTTKEMITRFLKKDLITNEDTWKRKKIFNSTHVQLKVEKGIGNTLIVERGILTIQKENFLGNVVQKKRHAERIVFNLKNPNQ